MKNVQLRKQLTLILNVNAIFTLCLDPQQKTDQIEESSVSTTGRVSLVYTTVFIGISATVLLKCNVACNRHFLSSHKCILIACRAYLTTFL